MFLFLHVEVGKMKKGLFIFLCAAIPLSVIIYGGILLTITWPIEVLSISNAGVFGDSFGVLTSLFSALAFLGVVLTLSYQREEFKLQKIELEENRKEIQKQGFENSFFQMLKLHNDILNSLSHQRATVNGTYRDEGRAVINWMQKSLNRKLAQKSSGSQLELKDLQEVFDEFYQGQGYQLAHYFRFLYNIFKFISESNIDDKLLYSRLARAQISNQELYIIFYNTLTPRGEKFRKYIVEFKMMDNLNPNELFLPEHKDLISDAGFKNESGLSEK